MLCSLCSSCGVPGAIRLLHGVPGMSIFIVHLVIGVPGIGHSILGVAGGMNILLVHLLIGVPGIGHGVLGIAVEISAAGKLLIPLYAIL